MDLSFVLTCSSAGRRKAPTHCSMVGPPSFSDGTCSRLMLVGQNQTLRFKSFAHTIHPAKEQSAYRVLLLSCPTFPLPSLYSRGHGSSVGCCHWLSGIPTHPVTDSLDCGKISSLATFDCLLESQLMYAELVY